MWRSIRGPGEPALKNEKADCFCSLADDDSLFGELGVMHEAPLCPEIHSVPLREGTEGGVCVCLERGMRDSFEKFFFN